MAHNEHVILPRKRITDPIEANLVYHVRVRLGDNSPAQYLFTAKTEIWLDYELAMFLEEELQSINVETPHTSWTLQDCQMGSILINGACLLALIAKATKETAEYMQYSDAGLALTLNKNQQYLQLLSAQYNAHIGLRAKVKTSFRPQFLAIGKQRMPFYVTQPLGMLPNMKQTFGV